MRVLLAEDHPVNRCVVVALLRRLSVEASAVADGSEVLAALESGDFDAILMDCHMPGMDGIECTRRIRAMPPPASLLPIIALTADSLSEDRDRCLDAGMTDYLPKPVLLKDLAGTLGRYVRVSFPPGSETP